MQRQRIFGHVKGVFPGDTFKNRQELSMSGVHRPLQSGISGSEKEGCDSIVLSGQYEDDVDLGKVIIYTGKGGRDLQTGKQVTDQLLVGQNLALAKNKSTGFPVRVIRGIRDNDEKRYRYDGLYRVDEYWPGEGKSGYNVWRFQLTQIITVADVFVAEPTANYAKAARNEVYIQRIIRNTRIANSLKELYDYKCQVCGMQLRTDTGYYSEAAHIKPLGSPHNGPDILENLLCLCPNHHVLFDFGSFAIDSSYKLIGINGFLNRNSRHSIDSEFLAYHKAHIFKNNAT